MTRLEPMPVDALRPDQLELYYEIVHGKRGAGPQHFALARADGGLNGPFNAFLLVPRVGRALQSVGSALRYEGTLSDRIRELAILQVAAHWDSTFEQAAHESVGRSVGLTEAEIAAVREGRLPELADTVEAAATRVTAALIDGNVSDDMWAEEVRLLGRPAVFELSTIVGYYATLALQMRVFHVD